MILYHCIMNRAEANFKSCDNKFCFKVKDQGHITNAVKQRSKELLIVES